MCERHQYFVPFSNLHLRVMASPLRIKMRPLEVEASYDVRRPPALMFPALNPNESDEQQWKTILKGLSNFNSRHRLDPAPIVGVNLPAGADHSGYVCRAELIRIRRDSTEAHQSMSNVMSSATVTRCPTACTFLQSPSLIQYTKQLARCCPGRYRLQRAFALV